MYAFSNTGGVASVFRAAPPALDEETILNWLMLPWEERWLDCYWMRGLLLFGISIRKELPGDGSLFGSLAFTMRWLLWELVRSLGKPFMIT